MVRRGAGTLAKGVVVKYEDISFAMRSFVGNREMLRRLGFAADELYCASAHSARNGGVLSCFLVVRTGSKDFTIECGAIASESALQEEYTRVLAAINSGALSDDDYARMFQACDAYRDTVGLIAALSQRGIDVRIPEPLERSHVSKRKAD